MAITADEALSCTELIITDYHLKVPFSQRSSKLNLFILVTSTLLLNFLNMLHIVQNLVNSILFIALYAFGKCALKKKTISSNLYSKLRQVACIIRLKGILFMHVWNFFKSVERK